MFDDDKEEGEGFLEFPSFESPSDTTRLENTVKELLGINLRMVEFVFNQAKLVALLDAKLELLTLEVSALRAQVAAQSSGK